MNRKAIFDYFRRKLGRGIRTDEVRELDSVLDAYEAALKEAGNVLLEKAKVPSDADGWLNYAVPLVQQFEGFHRALPGGKVQAYPDPASGGDPWTIGFGSTGPGIAKGTIWTRAQADDRFRRDMEMIYGAGVRTALGGAATTDRQMAAMVGLCYNIGISAFGKSTLLKLHKAGHYRAAADQFLRWNRAAGKVMPGLTRRRTAERALYLGDTA